MAVEADAVVEMANEPPIEKRPLCSHCRLPIPRTCICEALPSAPLRLERCDLIILQHPHELRRKNRSLPFIEFCVDPSNIKVVRSRRLTEEHTSNDDELFQRLLGDPKRRPVWLIYPDEEALPLSQAIHQLDNNQTLVAVSLLFIDATWNFAREMQKASVFPSHVQKVHLDETDLKNVQPRRFDIRTPPSDQHLSTAECIALVVSKVERNPDIYSTIMKPLDLTVQRWHDFANQKKKK